MIAWHDLRIQRSRSVWVSPPSFESSSRYVHIIGPNGAGKTSLLLALAQLLPYQGVIMWEQVMIRDDTMSWFPRMGWCPDTPLLPRHLTVSSAIQRAIQFKTKGAGRAPSAPPTPTHDLILQLGLHPVWHAPLASLSRGYQKRVGLAMALAHQPVCVLLDEPTLGLDEGSREVMRQVCLDHPTIQWVVATHRVADFPLPGEVVALSA